MKKIFLVIIVVFIFTGCVGGLMSSVDKPVSTDEARKMNSYSGVVKDYYSSYAAGKKVLNYIKAQYYMIDGKIEGIYETYYMSGRLRSICNYKDGLKNGKCTDYKENGEAFATNYYENDKVLKTITRQKDEDEFYTLTKIYEDNETIVKYNDKIWIHAFKDDNNKITKLNCCHNDGSCEEMDEKSRELWSSGFNVSCKFLLSPEDIYQKYVKELNKKYKNKISEDSLKSIYKKFEVNNVAAIKEYANKYILLTGYIVDRGSFKKKDANESHLYHMKNLDKKPTYYLVQVEESTTRKMFTEVPYIFVIELNEKQYGKLGYSNVANMLVKDCFYNEKSVYCFVADILE